MHLWRKSALARWFVVNETVLRAEAGEQLVVVERPDRKHLQLEVCCENTQARRLANQFGGRVEKLSPNWLERFSREQRTKPTRIGKRLVVVHSRQDSARWGANRVPYSLLIPAGAAFGTGDHATTAMSLRLLEEVSRKMKAEWSMADFGTGSGILALAAKCFGAKRVIGLDNDCLAVTTAKENARINKIDNVDLRVGDVRRWKSSARLGLSAAERVDVVTANLFSELLIEILPKLKTILKSDGWMILSGVLRSQERELRRALRSRKIDIVDVRRRGKWIAMLAKCSVRGRLRSIAPT
jgi:ribosomal protein L11 methyltransferase